MSFSKDTSLFAVTSDKGTCHVFHISTGEESKNTKSWFSALGSIVDLAKSEWSFTSYSFSGDATPQVTKCAFIDTHKLVCKVFCL